MSGAYRGFPRRFGGQRENRTKTIHDSLLDGLGSAFTTDPDSYVWAEMYAYAKAIEATQSAVGKLKTSWSPDSMTPEFVYRWERIMGIFPAKTQSLAERRSVIKVRMQRWGLLPNEGNVLELAQTLAPLYATSVVTNAPTSMSGSVPGGVVLAGGFTLPHGEWTAPTAHVSVAMTASVGGYDKDFYNAMGRVENELLGTLPAWTMSEANVDTDGFFLDVSPMDTVAFDE